jgi:hypothetical protein
MPTAPEVGPGQQEMGVGDVRIEGAENVGTVSEDADAQKQFDADMANTAGLRTSRMQSTHSA